MSKLNVSVSPHIRSGVTTTGIMLDVIIALLPAFAASVWLFGARALYITAICVLTCVLGELAFELITKRELTVGDLSAVVTGMLLSFNLPVDIPEWQAVIGSLIAIVVVKQLFGGIGCNFANPALTARVIMLLSFAQTTAFTAPRGADLVGGATPLALIAQGEEDKLPTLFKMLLGERAGSMGETCAIALIVGFIYLLCRKVITWHTPVVFVGTVFLLSLVTSDFSLEAALYQVLGGGLLLGAIFMATDYSTTPPTKWGKVLFGLGCGLLTFTIRRFGSYPEGVSFAILFMNILTPYISKLTARRPVGGVKAK